MRHLAVFVCFAFVAASPAAAVEFLGVELCAGSADTSVVLPVGSPLTLESAEIGRYGGLLLLFKSDSGNIMDHIDNLMAFYTDTRGTGDSKKLQWVGNQITAYAQLIKNGSAALAVSTTDDCLDPSAVPEELESAIAARNTAPKVVETDAEMRDAAMVAAAATTGADAVAETEAEDETGMEVAVAAENAEPVTAPAPTGAEVEPETAADFALKGRLKHAAADDEWVDIMGIVVNNSGHTYVVASFDLSLYDAAGDLICVDTISVNQLRDGQERAFRSAIRCADYDAEKVAAWKIQFAGAH
jgi:hypothetical protein